MTDRGMLFLPGMGADERMVQIHSQWDHILYGHAMQPEIRDQLANGMAGVRRVESKT